MLVKFCKHPSLLMGSDACGT